MIEKLSNESKRYLIQIIKEVKSKRKERFIEHFILRILDNSSNTSNSLLKIGKIINDYNDDEDVIIEKLVEQYEKENTERLDKLCDFYNS